MQKCIKLMNKLTQEHMLSFEEWRVLLQNTSKEATAYLRERAREQTDRIFGRQVYVRGLIEFTNICKKDCYYCGIRKGNTHTERYKMSPEQVYAAARFCKQQTKRHNYSVVVVPRKRLFRRV